MNGEKATKEYKLTEHERELNRKRVAKHRQNKKLKQESVVEVENLNEKESSYKELTERMKGILDTYANILPANVISQLFNQANKQFNSPSALNDRVKSISSLPVDFRKEEIGIFLQNPYSNEQGLRETSEILKWTSYPFFKATKTYQDIPTYHYCSTPLYLTEEIAKSEEYKREERLIDKINKEFRPDEQAHKIAGQAITSGKAFYYIREDIDKIHNKANAIFMQQLPTDYCKIIGRNNVSGWTVSFNLMYFMEMGTDPFQYGDLFKPYLNDFNDMFKENGNKKSSIFTGLSCKGNKIKFYPENLKANAKGDPRVFYQNGEWFYYVVLPIDRCYVFEIDDTTPAVASPLSGLLLTYAQQSDREAMETSLLLNPLLMLFTGEIPYFQDNGNSKEDRMRLSFAGRTLFECLFSQLMSQNNASGTAFFSAPVENIKSHTFPEVTKATEIASSYNKYAIEKSGLGSIIPLSDPKAGQANLSALLESRYTNCIYKQFERMMDNLYKRLNLKYGWKFTMFGSIYTDDSLRENFEKRLANGDTSVYPYLAALDGQSILDKISVMNSIKSSGFLDMLEPPATAYTQSGNVQNKKGGRPKNKKVTEGSEKTADSGDKRQ